MEIPPFQTSFHIPWDFEIVVFDCTLFHGQEVHIKYVHVRGLSHFGEGCAFETKGKVVLDTD